MYGVLDIGSNTIRLVIYKVENNKPVEVFNTADMACLASYRKDGNFTEEGVKKATESINKFKTIAKNYNVEKLFAFATASLRNVNNTKEAVSAINRLTNIDIDVISGEDEAIFDFEGTKFDTDISSGVMLDIGGGSSELVVYKDKNAIKGISMPFGSLTLYNDFVSGIFPNTDEKRKIEEMAFNYIKDMKFEELKQFCGVGGTAKASEKIYNKLFDGNFCPQKLIDISSKNPELLRNTIEEISPKRAKTIIPGIIVFNKVMCHFKLTNTVISLCGVKEGYISRQLNL